MPDLWLPCDYFLGTLSAMGQPTRQTQPSIPSESVIHVITWTSGVETITRQTRAPCGCLAAKAAGRASMLCFWLSNTNGDGRMFGL